jgi:hypothetical protein
MEKQAWRVEFGECFERYKKKLFSPLTPELNPSAKRCLTRFLLGILILEPAFR